jgi:hypothetical protein
MTFPAIHILRRLKGKKVSYKSVCEKKRMLIRKSQGPVNKKETDLKGKIPDKILYLASTS